MIFSQESVGDTCVDLRGLWRPEMTSSSFKMAFARLCLKGFGQVWYPVHVTSSPASVVVIGCSEIKMAIKSDVITFQKALFTSLVHVLP